MEELKSAMEQHMDLMSDLIQRFSTDLRSGFKPAYDNFLGFFHAIDWKEPWLICLMLFHIAVLLVIIISRKNTNFQMCLFLLALAGVYLAERLNRLLGDHWRSFAGQNYFDPQGLFVSVLWSGPLLVFAIIVLINTLFSLCQLIVKWKRAELRHRARLARQARLVLCVVPYSSSRSTLEVRHIQFGICLIERGPLQLLLVYIFPTDRIMLLYLRQFAFFLGTAYIVKRLHTFLEPLSFLYTTRAHLLDCSFN